MTEFSERKPAALAELETIDPERAARLLGCHPVTLLRWARQGRVPCIRLGSKVRFRVAALRAWMEAQERNGRHPADESAA